MELTKNFDSVIDFKLGADAPQWLFDMAYLHAVRLQRIRDHFKVPIKVTSFYRSPEYNQGIKYAAKRSLHTRGLAVDITVKDKDRDLLLFIFDYCKKSLDYGELFIYELPDGTLDSIHISLPALNNYKETLRYIKGADGKLIRKP